MAARLADVDGFKRTENTVQCLDPNGMTIRFEQSFVKEVPELKTEGINQYGNIQRVNAASPVYKKVNLLRLDMWCFSHRIWQLLKTSILKK